MLSLEDAQKKLIDSVTVIQRSEEVVLLESLGRVLDTDIKARHNQPPFPRSPLDGYALRSEDTKEVERTGSVKLEVVGCAYAGCGESIEVGRGQAVRIMTGAPIPKSCDAVIRQEDTDYGEDFVQVNKRLKPYQNYCFEGEDYKKDQILVEKGSILTPELIGIIASTGMSHVRVKGRLKIGVLSTGDELLCPGQNLEYGKIYNSNMYMLLSRLKELGCIPYVLGPVGDHVQSTVDIIERKMPELDLIITTGGVSVGAKDIMHPVIEALEAERLFWKIGLKPGTPALASVYMRKLIISLSGNPSAAAVTFELLFGEVFAYMMDCVGLKPRRKQALLRGTYDKPSSTRRLIQARCTGEEVHLPDGKIASGNISYVHGCNCLIDVRPGTSKLTDGERVEVIIYRGI